MTQKSAIAENFMNEFVKHLIHNSKKESDFPAKPEVKMENIFHPSQRIEQNVMPVPSEIRVPIVPPQRNPPIYRQVQRQVFRPIQKQPPRASPQIQVRQSTASEYLNLGKLNQILTDPRIESIECQGPDKNIIVKKDNLVQGTSLSLTAGEITSIINEFSEKTRIPLIEGTFKAAIDNLVMTAVISEFVGTRFIIQKKRPFYGHG